MFSKICVHVYARICAPISRRLMNDYNRYVQSLNKDSEEQLHKEMALLRSLYQPLECKASDLTRFCASHSKPHLPVTQV